METLLTRLQQSFEAWQASSSTKRQSNASLRSQAVKCLEHHSHRAVSAAIGMSVHTLRSWQKSLHTDLEATANPHAFVAVNLDHVQDIEAVNQAPLSLQVILPSGITIQVTSPSIKSSVALISALNKESQPCSI